MLKGRPLHGAAGETAFIVASPNQFPALVGLALDIGFGRLTLSMERVEILLQSVLGRLPRVDRATQCPSFRAHRSPPGARRSEAHSIWSRLSPWRFPTGWNGSGHSTRT